MNQLLLHVLHFVNQITISNFIIRNNNTQHTVHCGLPVPWQSNRRPSRTDKYQSQLERSQFLIQIIGMLHSLAATSHTVSQLNTCYSQMFSLVAGKSQLMYSKQSTMLLSIVSTCNSCSHVAVTALLHKVMVITCWTSLSVGCMNINSALKY